MRYFVGYSLKLFIEANLIRVIIKLPIVTNPFLKEVSLSIKGDIFHKVKWILGVPDRSHTNLLQQPIRHVLNVLGHLFGVHADKVTWECVEDEPLLNLNSFSNDGVNRFSLGFVSQQLEQLNRKLLMETFIARDELIREAKTWHETSLLEPENSTETATKEYTLHTRKRKEALSK